MLKTVTFEVVGEQRLQCESCELRVKRLLKGVAGVGEVRANSRDQRIDVLLDVAATDPASIAGRLEAAGYSTRIVPSPARGQ